MPTPAQAREEALFWLGQQDREHMVLVAMAVHEAAIRAEAARLVSAYEAAAAAGDVTALVQIATRAQEVKRGALELARKGWVGFLYPSLLEHMNEEVDHALMKIRRDVEPRHQVMFWSKERSGAAGAMGRLFDPAESGAASEALRYHAALRDLHAAAKKPSSGNVAPSVLAFTVPLDRFLLRTTEKQIASIAHPMLVQHELREGLVAEQALAQIAQGSTP